MSTRSLFALPVDLKVALQRRAHAEGRSMTAVVCDALVTYLQTPTRYLASCPTLTLRYPHRDQDHPKQVV